MSSRKSNEPLAERIIIMAIIFNVTEGTDKYLADTLERGIMGERVDIEKLRVSLGKEPGHAMEWADQYYRNAARIEVYTQLLARVKGGATSERIARILLRDMMQSAAFPTNSSSTSSNRMDRERLVVKAQLLEMILEMEPEAEKNAVGDAEAQTA
jgi:hypothetical protein